MKVPFMDLKAQYRTISSEVDEAVRSVIENTAFIGGKALESFETAFAKAHGAKHCIGVGNGTDAIYLVLRTLGIGPGDTVATAANTFIATTEAISLTGAKPLFVDCGDDYLMPAKALDAAIERGRRDGHSVRAVIPVHLYGRACDMTALGDVAKKHGCFVVEDCAQAHLGEHAGKKVGTFGSAGTFSFYPGKNLGAYGDGGAIITNDDALAERVRMLANHGRKDKYDHLFEGVNSRLDNLQAAILGVKLPRLEGWTKDRIRVADRYRAKLAGVKGVELPAAAAGLGHVYHLFVVKVDRREDVRAKLKEAGIDSGVHYPSALPNLPAYAHLGLKREAFPNASAWESRILSLPMFPEITDEQIDHVAEQLRRAVG